jgi:uncharacterized protein YrrD
MPSLSGYERLAVVGAGGGQLGRVSAVLFHPSEPRVVGLQVDRGSIMGVIDQRPRYLRFDQVHELDEATIALEGDSLPGDSAGERALGFSWDDTVIWHRMPVHSAEGDEVGTVYDVVFDRDSGVVKELLVSTGAVGDMAVGRLEVPASLVRGFNGESVVVEAGYTDLQATGGAAKAAASGVAALKERGGQVADGMLDVGVAASRALGRSLKSGMGRKAIDKMKSLMDDEE